MTLISNSPVIYLVDSDEIARETTKRLLETNGHNVVCYGTAESLLTTHDPNTTSCLLVDIELGGMSGFDLQDRLLTAESPIPIVFMTRGGDVSTAVKAMKKGALDFLEKPISESDLVAIVEAMLPRARAAFATHRQAVIRQERLAKLTRREAQLLDRLVAGRLNKQIADDLGVCVKTVEAHRSNLMRKLNVNTIAELLRVVLAA